MYREFGDLPLGIKKRVMDVIGGDVEVWVHQPIPALHNRSIIEVLNRADGEREVRIYLQRVESDSR